MGPNTHRRPAADQATRASPQHRGRCGNLTSVAACTAWPRRDGTSYQEQETERLRLAYAKAYADSFATQLLDNGVPARFILYDVDVPDTAASQEFHGVALQRSLQR